MSDVLCYSIDAESETGAPIAKQFKVRGFPSLIFLNADGSLRDRMSGYLAPEPFMEELARVKRDEDTISGLSKRVASHPDDVDARWKYAKKLREMGDIPGYERQVAKIRELDPEGKSIAMRWLHFEELMSQLKQLGEPEALYAFAKEQSDSELLVSVWFELWRFEDGRYGNAGDEERAAALARWLETCRQLWKITPEKHAAYLGGNIAWKIYERRDIVADADKVFALEVAQAASKAAGDEDANTLDTLACCYFMNGKLDEATALVKRCIELEPDNGEWQRRLEQFGG